MNKQIETNEAVELGSVSADTKGGVFTKLDNAVSLHIPAVLAYYLPWGRPPLGGRALPGR